jgi:nucleoside-diphosphate-sugar epimerase
MAGRDGIMTHLFCFGLGYSALRLARIGAEQGWTISGTARTAVGAEKIAAEGFHPFIFDGRAPGPGIRDALASATHVLISVPPEEEGDPVLRHHMADLHAASSLAWIGYLSTVGVYGDRQGGWVDETSETQPISPRSRRRLAAEEAWCAFGAHTNRRVQIFRLAGIYGPGRSAIDRLQEGTARRIVKAGQVFNRIHVDDIAAVLSAAIAGNGTQQVYNVTDDEPAPPQDVIAFAADLMRLPPPPEIAFQEADLSPMAASFYADNKRVSNARLREDLGVQLKFPSYREGLRAIAKPKL